MCPEVIPLPRKFSLTATAPISELNMTPLMDLTFILLITFIITFPLIEQGIPIELPRATTEELSSDDARTVSIDADGVAYLDGRETDHEALYGELKRARDLAPDVHVMIRADQSVRYREVVRVLKMLHTLKISRLALVTQEE